MRQSDGKYGTLTKIAVAFAAALIVLALPLCFADTITSDDDFSLQLSEGEVLSVSSTNPAATVNFNVTDGTLNATANLVTTDNTGTLRFTPATNGSLAIQTVGNVTAYVDGELYAEAFSFEADSPATVTWFYSASEVTYTDEELAAAVVVAVVIAGVLVGFLMIRRKRNVE